MTLNYYHQQNTQTILKYYHMNMINSKIHMDEAFVMIFFDEVFQYQQFHLKYFQFHIFFQNLSYFQFLNIYYSKYLY